MTDQKFAQFPHKSLKINFFVVLRNFNDFYRSRWSHCSSELSSTAKFSTRMV